MVSVVRKLKQSWRRRQMSRYGIVETRFVNKETVGSGGGAWVVCPSPLCRDSVVYSFGAGMDISFDLNMQSMFDCKVHIFDPTPRSINWISHQVLPDRIEFHPCGIGKQDGSMVFFPPRRQASSHFSPVQRYKRVEDGSEIHAPVKRLKTFVSELGNSRIDVLKIDIEGGEYDVLADILSSAIEIDQLLLEFHHSYSTIPFVKTVESVAAIKSAGFELYHLSERTYEMSFIHKRVLA